MTTEEAHVLLARIGYKSLPAVDYPDIRALHRELAASLAREAKLRDALAPFAARATAYDPIEGDNHHFDWSRDSGQITLGQLRHARAALGEAE